MSETNMPAAEVNSANERDFTSYEFAFHILPTVAEGEVPNAVEVLKTHIKNAGGEIFDEEAPKRFDLAYEIVKYLEGKNRKFSSAYFGWVRFRLEAGKLTELTETLDGSKDVLRYLLVKLTKVEEQNPFRFHDSIAGRQIRTIAEEDVIEVEGEEGEVIEDVIAEVEEVVDGKEGEETV